jgi:4-hydroxybenzoate polyprenyltransferase
LALAQEVALAFVAFCLLASAVYVGNDWLDRDADRAHPTKRDRPLASGRIGGAAAGSLAVVLTLAGLANGAWVGAALFTVLVAYLALNFL